MVIIYGKQTMHILTYGTKKYTNSYINYPVVIIGFS